jgi:iron(III) transport system permease protein
MTLLLLAAFTVWPLTAVAAYGLVAPAAWPLRIAVVTLVVAVTSTVLTLVPAALIAYALTRVGVPGRELVWRVVRVGVLIPPFIAPLALLLLVGRGGVLAPGGSFTGFGAIVVGQALAFLPAAVTLLVRALAGIPVELEHAAEVLGARRSTVIRRVTLRLAGPDVLRAALVVLGFCLADVAGPLLLGGDYLVLATAIVHTAAEATTAARAAVTLGALAATVALVGRTWRYAGVAATGWPALPRLDRGAAPAARWSLGVVVWTITAALAALWVLVPVGSLGHWSVLAGPAGVSALRNSVLLGLGAALAGTALALATAWIVERSHARASRAVDALARLPIAIPGVVAGVGYALVFGYGPGLLGGALLVLIPIVACWELPGTSRVARTVLVRIDRSVEDAAVSLGAAGVTTLTRIVVPALRPVTGRIFADLFAGGVLAVGTVIVLASSGLGLGAITMLTLAGAGAIGAACAIATALLALAGAALLLGRAIGGG